MSKSWIAALAVLGCLLMSFIVFGGAVISKHNGLAVLRVGYETKLTDNTSEFDNTKKKISQVAQVSDMQMNKLKEVYTAYAEARTNKSNNLLMSWVQESVPNVDTSTFNNLQNIITGSRDAWTMRQKELGLIAQQYNQQLIVFPWNFIMPLLGHKAISIKVITSTATEQSFETGKDDDTKLFN